MEGNSPLSKGLGTFVGRLFLDARFWSLILAASHGGIFYPREAAFCVALQLQFLCSLGVGSPGAGRPYDFQQLYYGIKGR